MKKRSGIGFLLIFGMILFVPVSVLAAPENDMSTLEKLGKMISRGLLNAVSIPVEVVASAAYEKERHPKAWPFTYPPRLLFRGAYRVTSAAMDVFIMPLAAPFINDITPLTEHMGLPDYAWQEVEEDF